MSTGDLAVFLGVSTLVIVTPGQDTVLTVRNTLNGGRGAGLWTAVGVCAGQATWALATSTGIAAVVAASETAFIALRVLGSAYLLFLGARTIVRATRWHTMAPRDEEHRGHLRRRTALRHGLISNLANPKMAAFFMGLLPQFAVSFIGLFTLGLLFCSMTLVWLSGYAVAISKAQGLLRRPGVEWAVEAFTGVVLIALGVRLAATGGWTPGRAGP